MSIKVQETESLAAVSKKYVMIPDTSDSVIKAKDIIKRMSYYISLRTLISLLRNPKIRNPGSDQLRSMLGLCRNEVFANENPQLDYLFAEIDAVLGSCTSSSSGALDSLSFDVASSQEDIVSAVPVRKSVTRIKRHSQQVYVAARNVSMRAISKVTDAEAFLFLDLAV